MVSEYETLELVTPTIAHAVPTTAAPCPPTRPHQCWPRKHGMNSFVCRLFGMSGAPAVVEATFWLLEAPDSLAMQSHRDPDGTGLGFFEDGRARVMKQPIAAYEDRAFAEEARTVRSATFIAHV